MRLDKQQQLESWYSMGLKLADLPKDLRSQNYTAFRHEVEFKIYELVEDLYLDMENFELKNSD